MKIDKRSSERLSLLRFPLIVGVVFIHAYGTEVTLANGTIGVGSSNYVSAFVQNFISQGIARIAVPLFFLMSGYFVFLGFSWSIESYKKKISSRLKTLVIPFLFWNISTLLLMALAQYHPATKVYFSGENDPISTFGVYDYFNAVIGIDRAPISSQFWFIRDLIVLVFLTPAISLAIWGMPRFFLVGLFALWFFNLWPVYVPAVAAIAFFYVGAYIASSHTSLFALDRFGIQILSSYATILIIDTVTKGYVLNIYIHHAGILLGVASALFLSKTVVGMDKVKKALVWAGSCSFFVFAVHLPSLTICKKITYKVFTPDSDVIVLALYVFIPAFVIFLSLLLCTSMKLITPRFLSVITGGR